MKKWIINSLVYLFISFCFVIMLTGIFYGSMHWNVSGQLPFWDSFLTYLLPWSCVSGFGWVIGTVVYCYEKKKP